MATKKIRVYELARELGVENQVVLDLSDELKIGVKSHSSSIDEPLGRPRPPPGRLRGAPSRPDRRGARARAEARAGGEGRGRAGRERRARARADEPAPDAARRCRGAGRRRRAGTAPHRVVRSTGASPTARRARRARAAPAPHRRRARARTGVTADPCPRRRAGAGAGRRPSGPRRPPRSAAAASAAPAAPADAARAGDPAAQRDRSPDPAAARWRRRIPPPARPARRARLGRARRVPVAAVARRLPASRWRRSVAVGGPASRRRRWPSVAVGGGGPGGGPGRSRRWSAAVPVAVPVVVGGPGGRGRPGPQGQRPRRKKRRRRDFEDLGPASMPQLTPADAPVPEGEIVVARGITIQELAPKLNRTTADLVRILFDAGEMVTGTQSLADEMIELIAEALGAEVLLVEPGQEAELELQALLGDDDEEDDALLEPRAPIVTVHGSRRPRQDHAARHDPPRQRRRRRGRWHHPAHRRVPGGAQRAPDHVHRHARATRRSPPCARAAPTPPTSRSSWSRPTTA